MPGPDLDDAVWLALHDVCLRGMASVGGDDVRAALVTSGFVRDTPRGCAPTTEGRDALVGWARLTSADAEAVARRTYDAFLPIDLELKKLASDWQLSGAAKKPALGPEDWKLVDRLAALDERAGPPLRALGNAVPRFATYRPRLRAARERIEAGEHDYFTGVLVDSYHTVWWHLHQDLLWALGIARADDPNQ